MSIKIIILELNKEYTNYNYDNLHFPTWYFSDFCDEIRNNMQDKDVDISLVFNLNDLNNEIEIAAGEKVHLFSNFPDNDNFIDSNIKSSNGCGSYIPERFEKAFCFFQSLLHKHKNLELHIIKNSYNTYLIDIGLRLISPEHNINIVNIGHHYNFTNIDKLQYIINNVTSNHHTYKIQSKFSIN